VTSVSNEIELRAPGDHRATVPKAQAVPAVPPPPGPPGLDSALQMMTRDLPVAELLRVGRRHLERGRPEAALEAFTVVLSLDPGNTEAAQGASEAGRQIREKAEQQRREAVPPPRRAPDP
jgi:hypothetical protein